MKEVQQVVGYACDEIQVVVECPHYCGALHYRGRETPNGVNLGHRIADCVDHNDNAGYVIFEVRPLAELMAKTKTRISVMNRNARLVRETMELAARAG